MSPNPRSRPEQQGARPLTSPSEIEERLFSNVKQAVEDELQAIEQWALEETEYDSEEYRQHVKAEKRSELIKRLYPLGFRITELFETGYPEDLQKVRAMWFPLKWMLRDQAIMATFKRYPIILPAINYIHNSTRFPHKDTEQFKRMIQINREVVGRRQYKGRWDWSSFVSHRQFYNDLRTHCNERVDKDYSIAMYKKLILKLDEIEALKKLGQIKSTGRKGRGGVLYSDGYYTYYGNIIRKHSFLTGTPRRKRFLRDLDFK